MARQRTKAIAVRYTIEGTHYYPLAKVEPMLADVSYLGDEHRHLFGFVAKIEVFDDDRELEFFQVQHVLKNQFDKDPVMGLVRFGAMSCEMIAQKVIDLLESKYGLKRSYQVEVSEDGENYAIVDSIPVIHERLK